MVLVGRVEGLPRDHVGRHVEQLDVEVADVLDVDVGALLGPPEDGDAPLIDREAGEDVDGQVQPLPRRVAADGGGADDHGGEVRGLVAEQDRLAHALVLVVVGEGHERMVLGDVRSVADPIHARRRGVDEPARPRPARDAHERLEAIVVDRAAQSRIQLEARIVRDAGEMDDRVHARGGLAQCLLVPDIRLHELEGRVTGQHVGAEQEEVDDPDPVALGQQLRDEHRSHVSTAAGHEYRRTRRRHLRSSAPRARAGRGWPTTSARSPAAPSGCS